MFKKKIEFLVSSVEGTTVKEVLDAVKVIKEKYPNAKIRVEVAV